jgi:hypothetical protein
MKHFRHKYQLTNAVENYFTATIAKTASHDKFIESPTIAGLALHLGFSTKEEFELYESKGLFGKHLKKARLRILAYYESRLHQPSPTGAMFALKSMGWDEKSTSPEQKDAITSIKVKLIETGPQPASTEKEIDLQ